MKHKRFDEDLGVLLVELGLRRVRFALIRRNELQLREGGRRRGHQKGKGEQGPSC